MPWHLPNVFLPHHSLPILLIIEWFSKSRLHYFNFSGLAMRSQWRLLLRLHRNNFLTSQSISFSGSSPCKSISEITSFYHYYFYSSSSSTSNSLTSCLPNSFSVLSWLFAKSGPQYSQAKEQLFHKVLILRNELMKVNGDSASVHKLLEEMGLPLFSSYYDGSALIELLAQLYHLPLLAVEVFNWRRQHVGLRIPITSEEYAKGITVAGRARNVDLAVKIFNEAADNGIKTSSTYNALMGAYMVNGFPDNCQALFREFKMEESFIRQL
ncbi:hypothetical protein RDABS01_025552 [Bienertia sinuspersici]